MDMERFYDEVTEDGRTLQIFVEFKSIKNVYARYRDQAIHVTCNRFTSRSTIIKLAHELLGKISRKGIAEIEPPIGDDYYFLFGARQRIETGWSSAKLDRHLRGLLKDYLAPRVLELETAMAITTPYKIVIRKMNSRYASNSKNTHTLTFSLKLAHYAKPIIDGVIVHELAHDKIRNHSPQFYQHLIHYYPDYRKTDKALKKGMYHYE